MGSDAVLLAAFGNPLWDICVSLPDNSVLSKFGLADDSSKEVTAVEFESLLKTVECYPRRGCPGGAALNTLRIFQWLLGKQRPSCAFFGCIGDDDTGKQLTSHIISAGIDARFKIESGLLTGSAVCLIHDDLRTLVAHLGAANFYFPKDLTEDDKNALTKVQLVYIENFFFSHSADVIWDVIKLCKTNGVAVVFNLSGAYLFENCAGDTASLIRCADIVIGNESEYLSFAKVSGWKNYNINSVASKICDGGVQTLESIPCADVQATKLEILQDLRKVVVVTRGHRPVLCGSEGKPLFSAPVLQPKLGIKDTTGAGDAFVAGFLFGIMHGSPLNKCVNLGCYASAEIIQQIGCTIPKHSPLTLQEIENCFLNLQQEK